MSQEPIIIIEEENNFNDKFVQTLPKLPSFEAYFNELCRIKAGKNGKHPLEGFFAQTEDAKNLILDVARKKFLKSHRGYLDFYRILFDELYDKGASNYDGEEARNMLVIHIRATRMFPLYKELSVEMQYSIMMTAYRKSRGQKSLNEIAMRFYYCISDLELDSRMLIVYRDYTGDQVKDYNFEYTIVYKNRKKRVDPNTGKCYSQDWYTIWADYNYVNERGNKCRVSFMASDIWLILSNLKEYEKKISVKYWKAYRRGILILACFFLCYSIYYIENKSILTKKQMFSKIQLIEKKKGVNYGFK